MIQVRRSFLIPDEERIGLRWKTLISNLSIPSNPQILSRDWALNVKMFTHRRLRPCFQGHDRWRHQVSPNEKISPMHGALASFPSAPQHLARSSWLVSARRKSPNRNREWRFARSVWEIASIGWSCVGEPCRRKANLESRVSETEISKWSQWSVTKFACQIVLGSKVER